jgi:hypothetical protein
MQKRQRIKQSGVLCCIFVAAFGIFYPGVGDCEVLEREIFVEWVLRACEEKTDGISSREVVEVEAKGWESGQDLQPGQLWERGKAGGPAEGSVIDPLEFLEHPG